MPTRVCLSALLPSSWLNVLVVYLHAVYSAPIAPTPHAHALLVHSISNIYIADGMLIGAGVPCSTLLTLLVLNFTGNKVGRKEHGPGFSRPSPLPPPPGTPPLSLSRFHASSLSLLLLSLSLSLSLSVFPAFSSLTHFSLAFFSLRMRMREVEFS